MVPLSGKKTDAGRQASETGTPGGFPARTASSASLNEEPAGWVFLLQSLAGRPLRLRIGSRSYRLSCDTIFFLEELAGLPEAGKKIRKRTGAPEENSFVYVCGTPESLVRTLEDLQRKAGGVSFRNEDPGALQGLGN